MTLIKNFMKKSKPKCTMCNGNGDVGRQVDEGDFIVQPCPSCQPVKSEKPINLPAGLKCRLCDQIPTHPPDSIFCEECGEVLTPNIPKKSESSNPERVGTDCTPPSGSTATTQCLCMPPCTTDHEKQVDEAGTVRDKLSQPDGLINCPDDNHLAHKDCPTKRQWGLEAARAANKAQAKLVKDWQLCGVCHYCATCRAYYQEGYNHVCPPWLKGLVKK